MKPQLKLSTLLTGIIIGCLAFLAIYFIAIDPTKSHTKNPLPDFSAFRDTQQKKDAFFEYLYPLFQKANADVLETRQTILKLQQRASNLPEKEKRWLTELADQHKIDVRFEEKEAFFNKLLLHIDVIPPALALAQAAKESGWGTSRFAQDGNNLFGQWCYQKGCGMIPRQRSKNARHEVATFDTVQDAVNSYVHNINTSFAYKQLREMRRHARKKGHKLKGHQLAKGLSRYSERGEAYVQEIQKLISFNQLDQQYPLTQLWHQQ